MAEHRFRFQINYITREKHDWSIYISNRKYKCMVSRRNSWRMRSYNEKQKRESTTNTLWLVVRTTDRKTLKKYWICKITSWNLSIRSDIAPTSPISYWTRNCLCWCRSNMPLCPPYRDVSLETSTAATVELFSHVQWRSFGDVHDFINQFTKLDSAASCLFCETKYNWTTEFGS